MKKLLNHTFVINNFPVKVVLKKMPKNPKIYGQYFPLARGGKIEIYDNSIRTFYHEFTHAIMDANGLFLDEIIDNFTEELLCEKMAVLLATEYNLTPHWDYENKHHDLGFLEEDIHKILTFSLKDNKNSEILKDNLMSAFFHSLDTNFKITVRKRVKENV